MLNKLKYSSVLLHFFKQLKILIYHFIKIFCIFSLVNGSSILNWYFTSNRLTDIDITDLIGGTNQLIMSRSVRL